MGKQVGFQLQRALTMAVRRSHSVLFCALALVAVCSTLHAAFVTPPSQALRGSQAALDHQVGIAAAGAIVVLPEAAHADELGAVQFVAQYVFITLVLLGICIYVFR